MVILSDDDSTVFPLSDNDDADSHADSCPSVTNNVIVGAEEWTDYWSDELLDLWYALKDQCNSRGLAILENCTFHDFTHFCHQFSSGRPPTC